MGVAWPIDYRTERGLRMNASSITRSALEYLPGLEVLYHAQRQARWQYKAAAGEHKGRWIAVLKQLDTKIDAEEAKVAKGLGISSYRGKRVLKG